MYDIKNSELSLNPNKSDKAYRSQKLSPRLNTKLTPEVQTFRPNSINNNTGSNRNNTDNNGNNTNNRDSNFKTSINTSLNKYIISLTIPFI